MSEHAPLVICLVGFPWVGKLTIATILARLSGARVIDNHWINDPILRIVASDGSAAVPEAVWPQVAKVREAVLETVATLAPASDSFIFTLAGADEDPDDRRAFEQYRNVALRRHARLIVIRLLCREEELVKRIQDAERRGRKLTDPAEAITNVRNYTPLNPSVPGTLSLDVTELSPEDAAARIFAHISLPREPRRHRRADRAQPHFCATSAKSILKNLGWSFAAWRSSSSE
jgi:AAA domain